MYPIKEPRVHVGGGEDKKTEVAETENKRSLSTQVCIYWTLN